MPPKLKYYIDKKGSRIYTLNDKIDNAPTLPAHYKFIKIRDVSKDKKE